MVLLAAVSAAACGEASLRVGLVACGADQPFGALAGGLLEVTVMQSGAEAGRVREPFDGTEVTLPAVPRRGSFRVVVLGYDAQGSISAAGAVDVQELPGRGDSCCIASGFCSRALYDGGGCTCGSGVCTDTCDSP
ncbi:MAG: hypothetical protein HY903_19060 [Deltaproteobacteria bacterium]|nr:hypothetical protein [Deltaproteobacteria bacterium]